MPILSPLSADTRLVRALLVAGLVCVELAILLIDRWTANGLAVSLSHVVVVLGLYRFGNRRLVTYAIIFSVIVIVTGAGMRAFEGELGHAADRVVFGLSVAAFGTVIGRSLARSDQNTQSIVDPLTSILNESTFIDFITKEAIRVRRYGTGLSLMIVEIDGFARIEQERGRDKALSLLKDLADVQSARIRPTDLIGRIGNRIAVAMPETDEQGSVVVAERLRDALAHPELMPQNREFAATVSCGIAWFDEDGSAPQVIARALNAIRQAQDAGGNCTRTNNG